MARWEPGTFERLRAAALTLYDEQGFEKTTVAQITERAGMNRRTFFHHFADKREVVFAGQDQSEEFIAAEIRNQPEGTDPLHAAVAGLAAAADQIYEQFRDGAVLLGRVIAASPELQERELVKRSTLAARIAAALRERGTAETAATVAGWTAVAIFFVARNQWNQPGNEHTLADLITTTLQEFLSATRSTPSRTP
ncbi:TetR/AcrR family transcriptional regulator [Actinoplanes sp. NPDC020271]|uniref:TetR/AcrR family transcriptional regulator n=1 Tax=Actinoplanes sp. NPDC020271 TaxID=3363896 RepID=UPI0037B8A9A6